ncbi:RHS repeat protein [Bradyrhizobium prioriisuperbiae]|uniref:RHS repeat protein n=1 Tax=Bradyrhizobium prioriisuperbiae TaxID=2854389 RepID=UPI0028ECD418|nr:RHS repeat protein [Bradyrhizobium prioritasuperba]
MSTTTVDQPVLSAHSFIGSIGVNAHVGYSWGSYDNLALVMDDLKYLGVTTIRDALATSPGAQPALAGLAAAGYKFDFLVPSNLPASGSAGLQHYLAELDAFQKSHPGSIIALEGLNEANIQHFSYNGSSSIAAAAEYQKLFYSAIKGDANLVGVSVYNLTLGHNNPSAYSQLGDLSSYSDYANAHSYLNTSTTTDTALGSTINTASGGAAGKPIVITETGYTTQDNTPLIGASESVQAKSILNTLVDAYKAGVSKTYLYELLDRDSSSSNTNPEANFGLFNSDGTPKLAATAIHNLTTILADDGTGGHQPTGSLSYSLDNMPTTGESMVLGKSNGAYEIVVWAEPRIWDDATDTEISNPAQTVTVHLGSVHHSVKVYDPMSGTTPIAVYTDVKDIQISVSDHPMIIEIDAPETTTPPPEPADVSGTAASIVLQLGTLNTSDTLKTITLTDTPTLPVASDSTMKYIISHYSKALAAIQGGYSFAITVSDDTWTNTRTFDSTGVLQSTTNIAYTGGVIISKVTVYADHSTDSVMYSAGVIAQEVIVKADGTKETKAFDAGGHLTTDTIKHTDGSSSTTLYSAGVKTKMYVANADGSHDTYAYNIQGKTYTTEVQHADATGKVVAVTRTHADGSLDYTQVINSNGTKITTLYDSVGRKTAVITASATATTTDQYDTSGTLTKEIIHNANGNVTTAVYTAGTLSAFYIANGDGSTETRLYDASGNLKTDAIQDTDGSSSTTLYSAGVKTKMYVTNADRTHDTYSYNIQGQSYTTEKQHTDATGKVISVTRTHADGSLDYTQVIKDDGSKVTTHYDATGHKTTAITITAVATTTDSYDASGRLTKEIVQKADGTVTTAVYTGTILSAFYTTNPDGSTETRLYDSTGSLASDAVQHTNGSSTTTLYSAGVKTKMYVNNADGTHDTYAYNIKGQSYTTELQHTDASGKVIAVTRTHPDGTLDYTQVVTAEGTKVTTHYDGSGRKMTVVAANAAATTTDSYDTSGHLTKEVVQKANGTVTTAIYTGTVLSAFYIANPDGSTETKLYDAGGHLTSDAIQHTDGSSSTTTYADGIKTKMYVNNADGTHDTYAYNIQGQSYTTEVQHADASGKVTSVIRSHADGSLDYTQVIQGDGTKVTDLYDAAGHKTSEIMLHTDGSSNTASYNTSGALLQSVAKTTDGDTTTTHYASGVKTSINIAHADGSTESQLFDSAGHLTSDAIQNTDGSSSTTLYTAGVKTKMYVDNADGTHDTYAYNIQGQSYTTEHQHADASGKITAVTRAHADGSLDYSQVIQTDGTKITDNYDSAGTKTQEIVSHPSGATDVYKYAIAGSPGAIQHEVYNTAGNLTLIDLLNSNGTHKVTAVTAGLTISGGNGNDLFASAGSTTITYDHGNDQINNFRAGDASNHDTIRIAQSLVADYNHLQLEQVGSDALVHISSTDSILLKNINVHNLDHSNFLFA